MYMYSLRPEGKHGTRLCGLSRAKRQAPRYRGKMLVKLQMKCEQYAHDRSQ